MKEPDFGEWQSLASAPRDGTRVLVQVKATEQGPAEVDMARWARPDRAGEACWISADSDAAAAILYEDAELSAWMPLPTPLPKRRARASSAGRTAPKLGSDADEIGGSGI